jgi:hypothetical protein
VIKNLNLKVHFDKLGKQLKLNEELNKKAKKNKEKNIIIFIILDVISIRG